MHRITSCAVGMFEAGLREAAGDFIAVDGSGAREKIHVVATVQERHGHFDGIYTEFFRVGVETAP